RRINRIDEIDIVAIWVALPCAEGVEIRAADCAWDIWITQQGNWIETKPNAALPLRAASKTRVGIIDATLHVLLGKQRRPIIGRHLDVNANFQAPPPSRAASKTIERARNSR